jgi:hypothetical protein
MIQPLKIFFPGFCRTFVLGALILATAWSSPSLSRTWYVKADGTGDAPTIQAGVDSAVAGDVVLIGAGTYYIGAPVYMKGGITVTSESGPYQTRILPVPLTNPASAFYCYSIFGAGTTEVSGFWIEGFIWSPEIWGGTACGILLSACGSMIVSNNVITGNGYGALANLNGNVDFRNNTVLGNTRGLENQGGATVICQYNIIWDDNAQGSIGGFCNDLLDISDASLPPFHFSGDPEFCGPLEGNFYLQSDSPCAPGDSPWPTVGLIGALPVGCGTVKVESHTWGAIKEMYYE